MNQIWDHRTAPSVDSGAAGVRCMDWSEAQLWCNFVLWRPRRLPQGIEIEATTVRPEAPPGRPDAGVLESRPEWTESNRAVHRAEYVGGHQRLRIKQFLYDYAPPAFDHPCLWESKSVQPFLVDDYVGWLGTDFRGLPAATVTLKRTTVEISVTEGHVGDHELHQICRGLRPVDAKAAQSIDLTTLAHLCYQSRHQEPPIAVPVGYWAHKRRPNGPAVTVTGAVPGVTDAYLSTAEVLGQRAYSLDSVFSYEDPREWDYHFQHADDPGFFTRLLVAPRDEKGGLRYPPVRETRQPCTTETRTIHQTEVHHAYLDPRYGQHEFVWQTDAVNAMLIVKPARWTSLEWAIQVVEEIVSKCGVLAG